jgi:hypothetical protein
MSGLDEGLDDLLKGINRKRSNEAKTSQPIGSEAITEEDKTIRPIGSEDIVDDDITDEDDDLDLNNLASAQLIQLKDLKIAVKKAKGKNPVFSVWSPFCTAMMIYLHRTTPRFSKSMLGRVVIEKALEDMYPELSKRIREEMEKDQ